MYDFLDKYLGPSVDKMDDVLDQYLGPIVDKAQHSFRKNISPIICRCVGHNPRHIPYIGIQCERCREWLDEKGDNEWPRKF